MTDLLPSCSFLGGASLGARGRGNLSLAGVAIPANHFFFNASVMKMIYLDRKYLCLLVPLTEVLFLNGEESTSGSVWLIYATSA